MQKRRCGLLLGSLLQAAIFAFGANAQSPSGQSAPSPTQLNLLYTAELWQNAQGGLRRGASYMNNVDVQLRIDTDAAFGWTGGRFWLEAFYENHTSTGAQYVGAVDQQSPIDAASKFDTIRLYQVYYDQTFGSTDVLFGIYDLETEFSVTKPMSLFLSKNLTWNTALDQSGTMPHNGSIGPGNYPYTPLALRVRQALSHQISVQAVIADAAADNPARPASNGVYISPRYGALGIAELDYTPSSTTKLMAGLWEMTSKLPLNTPSAQPRSTYGQQGVYVGGTTRLYAPANRRGLDVFFTYGASSPQVTNTVQSFNAGLVYTGPFDTRPHDKIGLSLNENVTPASYRQAQRANGQLVGSNETSFEATYRARVTDWLTLQPDVQYIINPGYNPAFKDDLLVGLHFEIGHLFDL